jgi:hypothetical protein
MNVELKEKLDRQWDSPTCAAPVRKACWVEMPGWLLLVPSQVYRKVKQVQMSHETTGGAK